VAVRAVEVGYDVVGFELDELRLEGLAGGDSFIEDIAHECLNAVRAIGRYRPSSDVEACSAIDVAGISLPTPLREGAPDLSYITTATATLARHLQAGALVMLESAYPGTTQELVAPLLERGSGLQVGTAFHRGFSPERIDPSNQEWTFERAIDPFVDRQVPDGVELVPVTGDEVAAADVLLGAHDGSRSRRSDHAQPPRTRLPPLLPARPSSSISDSCQ